MNALLNRKNFQIGMITLKRTTFWGEVSHFQTELLLHIRSEWKKIVNERTYEIATPFLGNVFMLL